MKHPVLNSALGGYIVFSTFYFGIILVTLLFNGDSSHYLGSIIGSLSTQINLLFYFAGFWIILFISSLAGILYNYWKTRHLEVDTFVVVFVMSSIVILCNVL